MAEAALGQKRQAFLHGQVGTLAGFWHDRRVDGLEQIAGGGQIVRQRHDGVRGAGIHHQGCLAVAAVFKQVEDLASSLFQAVGRAVLGEHLRGQFEQDHQWVGRALMAFFQALPAGRR